MKNEIFKMFSSLSYYLGKYVTSRNARHLTSRSSHQVSSKMVTLLVAAVRDQIENSDRTGPNWDHFGRNRIRLDWPDRPDWPDFLPDFKNSNNKLTSHKHKFAWQLQF